MEFSPQALAAIAERNQLIQDTLLFKETSRVPFMPSLGNVFCLSYPGCTVKDAMLDPKNLIPNTLQVLKDLNPDVLFAPTFFPKKTMDILGAKYMGWPGSKPEFGDNSVYQVHDHAYLDEDEYEDFLADPSGFLGKKVLAEKYAALGGLNMINPYSLCGTTVMGFAGLNIPPVKASLQALIEAATATGEFLDNNMALIGSVLNAGYPLFGDFVAQNPFDEFADNIRGLVNTVTDLVVDPDLVAEAVNRFAEVSIPAAIQLGKMSHASYAFIPLHAGVDEFMSPDDYHEYYWPPLKKLLDALIANNITPVVMCEGNYKTRLDVLAEIQPNKVIYLFEKQDMLQAKQKLNKIAAVGGNFSTNLLTYGTPEQVKEETKRMLDELAPGGGYIMSNDISIDNCKIENLNAWREAMEH